MVDRGPVIYPGTFDPPTNGHLDLVRRARKLFGRVIVAVAEEEALAQRPDFSTRERVAILQQACRGLSGVSVESFRGLLVQFARRRKARAILRGLRAVSDFEFEFPMTLANRRLAPELETIFLMPPEPHLYISSSLVKEIARLGGNVKGLVPPSAEQTLKQWAKSAI